jgi:hypothetical protein
MEFYIILLWIVAAYGMSTIIVYGSIFEVAREFIKRKSIFLGDLVSCMLCTSTWVGFFMSITLGGFFHNVFDCLPIIGIFYDGMFTAGSVWALNSIIELFENNNK